MGTERAIEIDGFLKALGSAPNDSLTHVLPECTALVLSEH